MIKSGSFSAVAMTARIYRSILFACSFMTIACLICPETHGAFISTSDPRFGAYSITLDTDTGLRWLDVPFSGNRSYNDVAAQFGVGEDFEGFRYATPVEVANLFTSFGLVTGPVNTSHTQFLSLFGATIFQGSHPETFGFALGTPGSGSVPWSGLDFFLDFAADPVNGQPNYFVINGTGGANPMLAFGGTGSFLVQPVPLPPGFVLFLSGLALLALSRKR